MREIQLGGRVAAGREALVDDADFELVNQYAYLNEIPELVVV